MLHATGLEFCQATASSIKRIVHMYILIVGFLNSCLLSLAKENKT